MGCNPKSYVNNYLFAYEIRFQYESMNISKIIIYDTVVLKKKKKTASLSYRISKILTKIMNIFVPILYSKIFNV